MGSAIGVLLFVLFIAGVACDGNENPASTPTPGATPSPAASTTPSPGSAVPKLGTKRIAVGFTRPTLVTNAGDGSGRLFVLEKPGRIRVIKDGAVQSQVFLDVTSLVTSSGNEQGLLGLAFHPDFEHNGRFFIAYTAKNADNTVAEYHAAPGGATADAGSGKVLFGVADQFPNHNGGMLAFGPDGYLYVSMGDGGSGGDPNGNGQNLNALLGKLLRIDVDHGDPYAIPGSNPFAKAPSAKPEVWAFGLRNPWRFTFDRETGDVWIGDVGQNQYEEIDFQPAGSKGGENYGWNTMEGNHCYKPQSGCDQQGLTKPIFEYSHDDGCSVTGGYVYRGKAIAGLTGRYVFTDYCSGTLWVTTRGANGSLDTREQGSLPDGVSAFGEDEAGELYFVVDGDGALYQLIGG